jgi:predicted RNA binding protein YcfA (HicA-like mRNA interferase family)
MHIHLITLNHVEITYSIQYNINAMSTVIILYILGNNSKKKKRSVHVQYRHDHGRSHCISVVSSSDVKSTDTEVQLRCIIFFVVVVLGFEHRGSCLLDRHFTA